MNEDAGQGGTRLDAAKQAVTELVDRLPEGRADRPARVRLEGRPRRRARRRAGDTELMIPVGPLDKEQFTRRRQRAPPGRGGRRSELAAGHARRSRHLRRPPERGSSCRTAATTVRRRTRATRRSEVARQGLRPDDLGRRPAGQRTRPEPARVHRPRRRRHVLGRGRTRASSATSWPRCWPAPTARTSRPGPRSRAPRRATGPR